MSATSLSSADCTGNRAVDDHHDGRAERSQQEEQQVRQDVHQRGQIELHERNRGLANTFVLGPAVSSPESPSPDMTATLLLPIRRGRVPRESPGW